MNKNLALAGQTDAAAKFHSTADLIEQQAARTPSAIALISGGSTLTYAELDGAATRLANRLVRSGLAPNTRIAVFLDRSPELLVALIAILRAGSAYVPLDPRYPAERLAHVFADARPVAIVSKSTLAALQVPPDVARVLVDLDDSIVEIAEGKINHPRVDSESPAYVIYTSGSTGVPKGVQIRHGSVTNLLNSMRRTPGMNAGDTLLAVTTVSFDIAVLELFLPLVVGAKIVLAQEREVGEGRLLLQLMAEHSVTVLQATPVTWQLLIAAGWRRMPQLKMLCGGEALSRKLADELLERGGELWNMYGPTETTVWSSVLRIGPGSGPVLLGPPIDNTTFYVLDEVGRQVAPGEVGELYIGGAGVASGYVGRPELTSQRFLPDPFGAAPEARLYRTGDLVRTRRKDGQDNYEFLGRVDTQVKIAGFRIELGEIEATLARHPAIASAVAVLSPTGSTPVIWSYVILHSRATTLAPELLGELNRLLQAHLPTYMHPAAITALAEFPLTPNGKVDRKAFPAPATAYASDVSGNASIESRLATVWSEVLGPLAEGQTTAFLAAGGRSLLAAELLRRIEAEFDVRLTLASLFSAPTIEEQAQMLRQWNGWDYDFRRIVRFHANGARAPLFAINNTGVYCYQLAQLLGPEQPLVALQLFDPTRTTHFPTTLEAIASEYRALLRELQPRGPYQLIGWCVGGVLAFEVARQLLVDGETIGFVGLIDAWAPQHLARLPRPQAWLADHAFRLKLVQADWRKAREGKQSIRDFLRHRTTVKRLLRQTDRVQTLEELFGDRHQSGAHYDRWIGHYLDNVAHDYSPSRFDGRLTLFSSSHEPRGLFIDPYMGWERLARSIDHVILHGDHFSIFRGVGMQQLAMSLSAALAQTVPDDQR